MIYTFRERFEERLRSFLRGVTPKLLKEAMEYYLLSSGKRVRPLVVYLITKKLKGLEEDAFTLGCALEMIHNYSLIHDDLPALDNDDFRRGKPTCHRVFGEDLAILAGDALLTLAFEVLSDRENFKGIGEGEQLMLIREVAKKSGHFGMVGGQVMDIRKLGSLEEINKKKTAYLFSACFVGAGIISRRLDLKEDLEDLGLHFGEVFQTYDDLKDKDGLYQIYGQSLEEILEKKVKELKEKAKSLNLLEEINYLLSLVFSQRK